MNATVERFGKGCRPGLADRFLSSTVYGKGENDGKASTQDNVGNRIGNGVGDGPGSGHRVYGDCKKPDQRDLLHAVADHRPQWWYPFVRNRNAGVCGTAGHGGRGRAFRLGRNRRGADRDTVVDPAGGLLAPGAMVSDVYFNTNKTRHRYLSLVAMLLPTNDGFVGLDSLRIPRLPGTYRYYLSGYDAGTEANDERITGGGAPGAPGIPADPGGKSGTGATGAAGIDTNQTVHIHRGIVGDTVEEGGISDLDSAVHRWLNPVAEVIVEVHSWKKGKRR